MKKIKNPLVSIIIVNYNGGDLLRKCFLSIKKQTYPNIKTIVVDNNSIDQSIDDFSGLISNIKVILCKKNYGFAKGNNIGIKYTIKNDKPKYILTLNNDTEIYKKGVEELVSHMEKYSNDGSAQSLLLSNLNRKLIDNAGIIVNPDGSAFNKMIGSKYDVTKIKEGEIFGPCAASAIYRSCALKQSGLFNESFFCYMEDVDLAWRLRLRGWRSSLVTSSIVYHVHSASSNNVTAKKRKMFYIVRNSIFILIKYYPVKYILLFPYFYVKTRLYAYRNLKNRLAVISSDVSYITILKITIKAVIASLFFFRNLYFDRKQNKIKCYGNFHVVVESVLRNFSGIRKID